jgi:hypothetical protein
VIGKFYGTVASFSRWRSRSVYSHPGPFKVANEIQAIHQRRHRQRVRHSEPRRRQGVEKSPTSQVQVSNVWACEYVSIKVLRHIEWKTDVLISTASVYIDIGASRE